MSVGEAGACANVFGGRPRGIDCSRMLAGATAGLGRWICFEGLCRALRGLTFLGGGRRAAGGAPLPPLGVLVGAPAGEALIMLV